jgi:class 3 adenylate cyclase/tetratricopeptide (TPR) repeat protein
MKCVECGFDNREEAKFCRKCGKGLQLQCPGCAHPYEPGTAFCDECGHDLRKPKEAKPLNYDQPHSYTPKHLAEKILSTRSSIEGERKLVTIIFADVANSTAMFEKLDPEAVHEIMDGCFRLMMDEIHRYEGTINQFRGDGVMALFGAPIAHEDHAQRACHAALSIQKSLEPYRERLKRQYGADFKLRIGLNSGAVVVGAIGDDLRMDYTAQGDTANLAARMETSAEPGKVLVSENTYRLAKDFFTFKPMRKMQLKGKQEPQKAYELLKPTDIETRIEASVARGLKELVGREDELEALSMAFEKAKPGEAQVVDIVGEAGIGKSRLVYEFQKTLGEEAFFLTGACVHYGRNMNFLPVIDVVRAAFGIEEGMTEEEVTNRIVARATDGLLPMIPFYQNLLSLKVDEPRFKMLNPEGRKFGTFEAVKNLLLTLSADKPLVVFLEDVHWIDKISEELFAFFSRCILDHPILMLAAYRPEGSPPWAQGAHYQRLGLKTLGSTLSIRLVRNLVGGLPLDPDLEKKIVAKTGGNPFFVEEVVRELLDRGDIHRKGDQYICDKPIDNLEIPNTVHGVLSARMDRLNEDLKRTMQVASVIGRDFAFRLLKSIMELGDELRTHLTNLVGLEVLYEKSLYPELEYIFKHALTQEVAYESLLKQRRREVHGRIAQAIEELYADNLEPHCELLAHHWELSAEPGRSIEYLVRAGEKSNSTQAAATAVEFFTRASNQMQKSDRAPEPQLMLRILSGRAGALHGIGSIEESFGDYQKAISMAQQIGDMRTALGCLCQVPMLIYNSTLESEMPRICDEGLELAHALGDKGSEARILTIRTHWQYVWQRSNDFKTMYDALSLVKESAQPASMFAVRLSLATLERWSGNPSRSLEHSEGLIEILRSVFNIYLASLVSFARGWSLTDVGRYREALQLLSQWVDILEHNGVYVNLGRCLNGLGWTYAELYDVETAFHFNSRALANALALREKSPAIMYSALEMQSQCEVNLMENAFDMGKVEEAWEHIVRYEQQSARPEYDMLRDRWASRLKDLKATILLGRGDLDAAEGLARECLEVGTQRGYKKYVGKAHRLLGRVMTERGAFDKAEDNLRSSLEILETVGNPKQIWISLSDLARLYERMNRSDLAREQWQAALAIAAGTAEGLQDDQLRRTFLSAAPIAEIMGKANQ